MGMQIDPGYSQFGGVFVALVMLLIYVIAAAVSVVQYVLQSLGTYTLAKRRGIRHPWLAWLPVGINWIWGSLADQYQYVAKGRIKNRRKVLLVLNILIIVLGAVILGMYINLITQMIYNMDAMSDQQILGKLVGILALAVALYVLSVVSVIIMYIVLHNIYVSCSPDNAVLYLVLSIVFSFLMPVFVFVCRKKDAGMPPRKTPEPEPVQPVLQEPWEQA